jgi:hypothetical protein
LDINQVMLLLFGGMFLVALVAIVGGFLHYRRERLLTHEERLKALDLGRELPDDAATARMKLAWGAASSGQKKENAEEESDRPTSSLSRKAFSTAIWVAFWGFLAASQSTSVGDHPAANIAVAIAIAAAVGAIGVTCAICGTILALRAQQTSPSDMASKPAIETDALDLVSRRG